MRFHLTNNCIFILAILISPMVVAQYSVREYKNPDLTIRAFELDYNQWVGSHKNSGRNISNEKSYYSIDLNPRFSIYRSNKRIIATTILSLESSASYNVGDNSDGISMSSYKQSSIDASLYIEQMLKYYYFRKLFFETGIRSNLGYRHAISKNEVDNLGTGLSSSFEGESTLFFPKESIPVAIGIGRVYQSTDARMAIYIIEELQRKGLINQYPDGEVMGELSRLMTKIKNDRVFDSRLKKIYELTRLDSLLREKGIVSNIDAAYFTTIYDNWLYAFAQNRLNGWEFKINYIPSFQQFIRKESYSSFREIDGGQPSTEDFVQESQFYDNGGYFSIRFNYHLPIGNRWQIDAATFATSFNMLPVQENRNTLVAEPGFGAFFSSSSLAEANVSIGYFPTSRTQITLPTRVGMQVSNIGFGRSYRYINTGLQAYYYLSPYFRIIARYSYNLTLWDSSSSTSIDRLNYVQAGFKYILF
ncbi:MAG: hypothetical protein JKY42_01860 [Flavobacteriales bacterium]|nr:hypothetical protein [Flavobacteriales bacterium]